LPSLPPVTRAFLAARNFGEPALIGPANHIDVHPQLDLALRKNLTFKSLGIQKGITSRFWDLKMPPGRGQRFQARVWVRCG